MRANILGPAFVILSIANLCLIIPDGAAAASLPAGDFGSSVKNLITSDRGDFGKCLRDLFLKFQLHVDGSRMQSTKDEMIGYGWTLRDYKDAFEVTLLSHFQFDDLEAPVSLHVRIDQAEGDSAKTLSVYLNCETKLVSLKNTRRVFRDGSVWSELIGSEDVSMRIKGRSAVSKVEIAYEDVNPEGGFGEVIKAYGFAFRITCRSYLPKLDQITLNYTAVSGLDPVIYPVTGTRYPGNGHLIDKWPPTYSGEPSGEAIFAKGRAAYFRFQGASFSQEK